MTKTPQEKKRLSYAKDRRNVFGENSKASRKGIPLAKARANRADRHEQNRMLETVTNVASEDVFVGVEVRVRSSKLRQWKKTPDKPLSEWLVLRDRRKARRET